MRAAIETLAALPSAARRIAVLGEMRELGRSSERYHREIGAFAATDGKLDLLACVGAGGAMIADSAVAAGFPISRVQRFIDAAEAASLLPSLLNEGDLVLLKASRGVRLEQVAAGIARRSEITRRAAS
jgi:UDP-N-acetylmuramoyl-tripeptide--D-alanyl-D-alanine ligase